MKKILMIVMLLLPFPGLANGFPINLVGVCAPQDKALQLLEKFGRVPFVQADGQIRLSVDKALPGTIRIFVNPATWTFSIMMVNPEESLWCLIAEGSNFRSSTIGDPI
jgi:hypothetical protein